MSRFGVTRPAATQAINFIQYFSYLQKVLGILLENRIESEMEQMRMFISSVMIKVDEIFNVEMGSNVFYILQRKI